MSTSHVSSAPPPGPQPATNRSTDRTGRTFAQLGELMNEAAELGADTRLWSVSQFTRMPWGQRTDGAKQEWWFSSSGPPWLHFHEYCYKGQHQSRPGMQRRKTTGTRKGSTKKSAPKRERNPFRSGIDPVTLSEEADQPELNLLGKDGFLRKGGGMFIIGPTESGKSSLATQLSGEWGCNHPNAIIKTANNQALRVLMVQSEDDRQDSREMARCIRFLKLSKEQREQVKKNVRFAQWYVVKLGLSKTKRE